MQPLHQPKRVLLLYEIHQYSLLSVGRVSVPELEIPLGYRKAGLVMDYPQPLQILSPLLLVRVHERRPYLPSDCWMYRTPTFSRAS